MKRTLQKLIENKLNRRFEDYINTALLSEGDYRYNKILGYSMHYYNARRKFLLVNEKFENLNDNFK